MPASTLESRFQAARGRIVDWHTDGVRANWQVDSHRLGPRGSIKAAKRKRAQVELRHKGRGVAAFWDFARSQVRTRDELRQLVDDIEAELRALIGEQIGQPAVGRNAGKVKDDGTYVPSEFTREQRKFWAARSDDDMGLDPRTLEELRREIVAPEQTERVKQALAFREEGKSYQWIAEHFGVSKSAVQKWVAGKLQGKRERKLPA